MLLIYILFSAFMYLFVIEKGLQLAFVPSYIYMYIL